MTNGNTRGVAFRMGDRPAGPELERRWLGLQTISIPLDGGLETSAPCTRPFLGGDPSARQTHGGVGRGVGDEGRERDSNGGFTRREVTMVAWGTSTSRVLKCKRSYSARGSLSVTAGAHWSN